MNCRAVNWRDAKIINESVQNKQSNNSGEQTKGSGALGLFWGGGTGTGDWGQGPGTGDSTGDRDRGLGTPLGTALGTVLGTLQGHCGTPGTLWDTVGHRAGHSHPEAGHPKHGSSRGTALSEQHSHVPRVVLSPGCPCPLVPRVSPVSYTHLTLPTILLV